MSLQIPKAPFFLPPHEGDNKGVDFLGLRQANLDMMGEMIPSINNVSEYIRPFSLLAWIYWKFYRICLESGIEEPSNKELKKFRERIEVLFTWGGRLEEGSERVPGKQAIPPLDDQERQPLTFEDWGRIESSTSLGAALWYGPASKTVTGLGFLMPVPGKTGFFRVTDAGERLADALDLHLRIDKERYVRLLSDFSEVTADESDAVALWSLWRPENLTDTEKKVFSAALFKEDRQNGEDSLLARRSKTLALAMLHISKCTTPQSSDEIRRGMFLSLNDNNQIYEIPESLVETRTRWFVLQMRQLQRFSMEIMLSWCEERILEFENSSVAEMAQSFIADQRDDTYIFKSARTVSDMIAQVNGKAGTVEECLSSMRSGELSTPFLVMSDIQKRVKAGDSRYIFAAFYGLILCSVFSNLSEETKGMPQTGGSSRISLKVLSSRLKNLGEMKTKEAVEFILETMIVSQHFSTAVNRFDGQNQRLRLTIEETGLTALVSRPWRPKITEDRLPTLLSLAAQSQLIRKIDNDEYISFT
jgi:hypothetical protein